MRRLRRGLGAAAAASIAFRAFAPCTEATTATVTTTATIAKTTTATAMATAAAATTMTASAASAFSSYTATGCSASFQHRWASPSRRPGASAAVAAAGSPHRRQQNQRRLTASRSAVRHRPLPASHSSARNRPVHYHSSVGGSEDGGDDTSSLDEEQQRRTDGWLRWMTGGQRPLSGGGNGGGGGGGNNGYRGVAEVKMREAAELGGLPRSDKYSSKDWWHNTVTLPNSGILRDIRSPVLSMTAWATLVSVVHRLLLQKNPILASHMSIPTTPHSLMVSALGLLLVFRTNSAYQRFAEGRKIWEQILSTARDLSRMAKLYEVEIGAEKRRRVQRLLAAFPYLLRYRIRPNSVKSFRKIDDPGRDPEHSLLLYQDVAANDNDMEAAALASDEETFGMSRRRQRELYWVDSRTLPWRLLPEGAMKACARAQNRPLWVCDRMAKELASVPDGPNFTNRERLQLVNHCDKLSRTIGACERIHQTVVPLNYARHALRSLTLWLLSLPFALVRDAGLMTGSVLCVVSWMLFGVYEIGTKIEDPFQGTLRLSILCDQIRRDVLADELIRETAFTLDAPKVVSDAPVPLAADGEDEDEDEDEDENDTRAKKGKDAGDGFWILNGSKEVILPFFN